jgi:mannose-1-phosphate guanylyltransferase/phosphomannomutase
MRLMIEAVRDKDVDHADGIKVWEDEGWAQVLPDPDHPVFHVYAEGRTREESEQLEEKYRRMLEEIIAGQPVEA